MSHPLDGASFFAGPVSEGNELAPGDAAGERFDIANAGAPVRFACRYRGTDVMLTRPVPQGVRECVVGPSHGTANGRATVSCR